jgi:hypothetical protein
MLKRTLFTALAAALTLAFAASAQAAYLNLGTTNTSNTTTALSGDTTASELLVKNTNDSSSAFGLYGLLTATSPTVNATAVRGQNSATNGWGYGVWGTQAGSGTGVYGFTPSGKGVWGNSTSGTGVRGTSSSGTGILGQHTGTSGTAPGVEGLTSSTSGNAAGVYGASSSSGRGVVGFSDSWQGVYGHSNSQIGVVGESGSFDGVWGQSHASCCSGVSGHNDNGGYGVWGGSAGTAVKGQGGYTGVAGDGTIVGVSGTSGDSGDAVRAFNSGGGTGLNASSLSGYAVDAESESGTGVYGSSSGSNPGVWGHSVSGAGVYGITFGGDGVYGSAQSTGGEAAFFDGNVQVTKNLGVNGNLNVTGTKNFRIDDPRAPARRFLVHAAVESNQVINEYSGNVTTNGKGFATVTLPGYFQLINTDYRYQLTVVGRSFARAIVWSRIAHNRFTIRTDQPNLGVSWQVSAKRNDKYMRAHPFAAIQEKTGRERGRYVTPELYGKPRSDGIGYRKPPVLSRKPTLKK